MEELEQGKSLPPHSAPQSKKPAQEIGQKTYFLVLTESKSLSKDWLSNTCLVSSPELTSNAKPLLLPKSRKVEKRSEEDQAHGVSSKGKVTFGKGKK